MRRVLNFGSINIDHIYRVARFVRPGETLSSAAYTQGTGGKGFNQSIALARAGAQVAHAGAIGADGLWLVQQLAKEGVDVSRVQTVGGTTGHAIIQVAPDGQNAIILHPGANHALSELDVRRAVADFGPGDAFLCQNETTAVPAALAAARARGLEVWFNPAPMSAEASALSLASVDWLIVNETEGATLSGTDEPRAIVKALRRRWSSLRVVVTLGAKGAIYGDVREEIEIAASVVEAIDTTGAGDTFIGYLMASVGIGLPVRQSLERACRAATLSVTRQGAAASVPFAREL